MAEYIEREAAMAAACKALCHPGVLCPDFKCAEVRNAFNAIPAADVRPVVRGKWIDRDDDYYGWNMWACSVCGEEFVLTEGTPDMNDYHYCPNCGADMMEES